MVKMTLRRATATSALALVVGGAALAAPTDRFDMVPPVLKHFGIRGSLDVQRPDSRAQFDVHASDDLSGVLDVYINLVSPSGRTYVNLRVVSALPQLQLKQRGAIGTGGSGFNASFGPWAEAGDWTVQYVLLFDAAGNQLMVPGSTLAAHGWSDRLTVQNSSSDGQPPLLVKGSLGVAEVSLSDHAPGVSRPPYIHASLNVRDVGDKAAAGLFVASLRLCRSNDVTCSDSAKVINLYGYGFGRGKKPLALTVAGQPNREGEHPMLPAHELGDYRIVQVLLRDNAGNETTLKSTDIGGTTDFKTLFDNTIFTLKP